jgi:cell filamentation protein
MSKYQLSNSSIYIKGTNIPKNKFGIISSEVIAEVEKLHLEQSYNKFSSKLTSKTILDETYFINLHKKTFESLYDFAGVYRNVNMTKGDSQFCLAQYLHSESKRIFQELELEN